MDKPTHLWDHIWVRDLALIAGAAGCVWLLYAVRAVTLPALVLLVLEMLAGCTIFRKIP